MRPPRRLLGKKLLVASIGVAAINYAGCAEHHHVGNLMAPPDRPEDAGAVDPLGGSPENAAVDASTGDNGATKVLPVATGTPSAAPVATGSGSAAVVATGTPPKPTASPSAVPSLPIRPPHAGNLMAPRPNK